MDSTFHTAPRDTDIINETVATGTLGFDSPNSP